ncbi:MAG: leucine-rich repeat protein, partial [Bacilli bacterium]|nr:leucine-rich repeat protein [Bacilli bacterium]
MKKIILLAFVLCSLFLVGCKKDELKTYNITYKLFKGDFSEVSKDTFLKTELPFEIQIPVKPGYEFVGWYDNESYTGDALLSITLEQDYTLFAKWEINTYIVSFETNGGEVLDSITVPYKTEIDAPVDPVKEGYIFMDWYVDEVCLVKYSFYDEVISDFTLYAKWTQVPTEGLVFEEYSYGEYYKVTDYTGSSTEVIIPDYYNKKPVALIDYSAFYQNEDITSVRLPETLKEIKQLAFSGCVSLEAVSFPTSLEIIENMAYYGCEALVEVVIPETVKSVSTSIFSHCINLESATILAPLTTISSYLFYFCSSLTSVSLPSTVEEIHVEAFGQCASLETIVLPEGVTKLSYGVFNSCTGLKNINLPNSITEIAGQAFANCFVLESITLPNSITSIEATTFMACW